MNYTDDYEIVTYWADELEEEFPDLPLNILKIEYEDAIGTMKNEYYWALGSNDEDECQMHNDNAALNSIYAEWLDNKAFELYGERLAND